MNPAKQQTVHRYEFAAMTPAQKQAMIDLWKVVWPPETASSLPNTPESDKQDLRCFVVWDGPRAIATSQVFIRTLKGERGEFPALCLASVCVLPEHRGEGLGKRVVEAALNELGSGGADVMFWQTERVAFYEKLGARCVDNRFVNGTDPVDTERNPFWDPQVMVYPADATWPEGVIDINGPGF